MRKIGMRNVAALLMVLLPLAAGVAAVAQDAGEEETASLTAGDMEANAESMLEKMRSSRKYVQNLLDAARKEKDIIKITCLNDKLTQINVSVRTFEDRMVSMRTALKTGDREAVNHEYNILSVLGQKVDGLRLEAEACIGESEGYLGKTEITVVRPEGEAELDPTDFEALAPDVVELAIPASAFE